MDPRSSILYTISNWYQVPGAYCCSSSIYMICRFDSWHIPSVKRFATVYVLLFWNSECRSEPTATNSVDDNLSNARILEFG